MTYTQTLQIDLLLFAIVITTFQSCRKMGCTQSQKQIDSYGILTKPHIFFLIGGPGSGKGTQSQKLISDYKFKHLSTGDLLRDEKQKGGQLAETIDKYIKQGKLLPSQLVVRLLKKGISTYGNRRYLFDGFPRNQQNWQEFQKQLGDLVVVRNLIYFECNNNILIERIMERSKLSGRTDDNPQTLKKRLETFEKQTLPIVKCFQQKNNCIKIDATKTKQQVYQQIQQKLLSVNVQPPQKASLIFVLGGPGSGKGTQCDILVKKYGFIHLSTGDLLRQQVKSGSNLGKQIDAVIKQGKLISSDLMVRLVQQQMERNNYGGRYLLDGFPRGQQNMDVWQQIMAKWVNLKTVIYFECNQQQLKRRIIQRGKTSGRNDDNQIIIAKRLQVFYQGSKPVVQHYQKQGKLKRFNAMRPIQAITADLEQHLSQLGIFPKKAKQDRPKAIIIIGNSGSGKTTQSKNIAKQFGYVNIAMGDILRQQIKNKGRHAQLFQDYIKKGKLVPSDIIIKLIRAIVQKYLWKGVFVLDGFPRCKQNLKKWNEQLGSQIDLECMFFLQCDQKLATERMMKRNDNRVDDDIDIIQKKIETYEKQTYPVIKQYIDDSSFTSKIDASQGQVEVYNKIKQILIKKGFHSL